MFLKFIFCGLMVALVKCDRKLNSTINPGCNIGDQYCQKVVLVHVKAEGENDILHHVWDLTGKPSLLIALTEKNVTLNVSWINYSNGKENSISFSSHPKYVFGMTVDKLIEFNDVDNTAALDFNKKNLSYISFWDTKNFNWQKTNYTNNTDFASVTVEATEYYSQDAADKKNGTIRIVLRAYGALDHAETLPHLLHSGNTSQFELTLEGMSTRYANSRFGLHLVTVSSENKTGRSELRDRKTMDDEHAPGIFTIVEMLTPAAAAGQCGGYLQWRPLVYTTAARDITGSTDSTQYALLPVADPVTTLNTTLPFQLFGYSLADALVTSANITFGGPSDGFYRNSMFASWTTLVGYGRPPQEQFSPLVWLVLAIGLGLPAALILAGAVCVVVRRLQRNKDDLFLGR